MKRRKVWNFPTMGRFTSLLLDISFLFFSFQILIPVFFSLFFLFMNNEFHTRIICLFNGHVINSLTSSIKDN